MRKTCYKRVTMRITGRDLDKLSTAAAMIGTTVNQFAIEAALERAETVIESESSISLARKGSLWLFDRLDNPPPRNAKFKAAQADYYKAVGSDRKPRSDG